MSLSDEQQKVLTIKQGNLLVNASAGSGKTTVMVQKIIDYIKNGISIDNILAVTFTVKAAGELKERLIKELANNQENVDLLKEADKVAVADICTLHSFCQKLLKKYFYKIQLSSAFEVIDEDEANYVKFNALQKIIDAESENPNFYKLIAYFKDRKNTDNLKKCIIELYEFINSISEKNFLDTIAFVGYDKNLNRNLACLYINQKFNSNMQKYINIFDEIGFRINNDKNQYLLDFFNKISEVISDFSKNNSFEQNIVFFKDLTLPQFTRKNFDGYTQQLRSELKAIWDKFVKFIKSYKELYIDRETIIAQIDNAKEYLVYIVDILKKFMFAYNKEKQDNNQLDFNDLEKFTIQLLEDNEVVKQIKEQYKKICIDEYQDINEVQETILQKISDNNLLMVGDTKQSIYGFRNSSPDIFAQKARAYKNKKGGQVVPLLTNYRSCKEILFFANDIFKNIMTTLSCDIDYANDAMFKENPSRVDDDIMMDRLQLCIVKKSSNEDEVGPHQLDSTVVKIDYARLEAKLVVDKIYQIKQAYQNANKEFSFDKICVLCRNKGNEYNAITEELLNHNIPVSNIVNEKLYDNNDIMLLVNFLRLAYVIDNDIALASCLTSPFVGVSFDELYNIKKTSKDSLYVAIRNYKEDSIVISKINKLFDIVAKIKKYITYHSIYQTLNYLDDIVLFRQYYLSLPNGQKRTNLINRFIDGFLSADYNYSLEKYLYYVDNFANSASFKFVNNIQGDSVYLGTMHSSKGLDFENVIVAGIGNTFDFKMSQKREIAFSKNLGLGAKCFDIETLEGITTITKEAIKRQTKEKEFAEELRLMYVALTRAKERLIMIGTQKNAVVPLIDEYDIFSNSNILSLILASLNITNANTTNGQVSSNGYKLKIDYFNQEDIVSSMKQDIKPITLSKEKKCIIDKYHKPKIALKNSVSELYEQELDIYTSYNFEPKQLTINEGEVSATNLGTYIHNIMQLVDFKKDDIENQLENIQKQLGQNIAVDIDKIKNAILLIKNFNAQKIIKEQKFISRLKYNEIFESSNIDDKIIIQGVADLILIGKENILIDYKTSNIRDEKEYQKRYGLQLKIYKIALQKALDITINKIYIYSFVLDKLIPLNI